MCVCAGMRTLGQAVCGAVARRARRRACRLRAAWCVGEAAHVRLGATMASELAEKRSAIAVDGLGRSRSGCEGHFADTDKETSADFHLEKERGLSRFQRDFIERRAFQKSRNERPSSTRLTRTQHGGARSAVPPPSFGMPCAATGWADDIVDAFFAFPSDAEPHAIAPASSFLPPLAHAGGTAGWADHR